MVRSDRVCRRDVGRPSRCPKRMPLMDKRQLIDDIRRYNVTARPQFLAEFDEAALRQYLEHLEDAHRKRVRFANFGRWVRPAKAAGKAAGLHQAALPVDNSIGNAGPEVQLAL